MTLVTNILDMARQIKNSRDTFSVLNHTISEVVELQDEVYGVGDGKDGIIGEAIDVILCCVDLIYTQHPDITEEELIKIADIKLAKWKRLYGDK
jgi:hypothetical protein